MRGYWKMPWRSRLARWIAGRLPSRVLAWVWLDAYDDLDQYMRDVKEMEDNGYTHLSSISGHQLENRKRDLCRLYLKAKLVPFKVHHGAVE